MSCDRAARGLMIRPAANTPSSRGTRTSPVAGRRAPRRTGRRTRGARSPESAATSAVGVGACPTSPSPSFSRARRPRPRADPQRPGAHRAAGDGRAAGSLSPSSTWTAVEAPSASAPRSGPGPCARRCRCRQQRCAPRSCRRTRSRGRPRRPAARRVGRRGDAGADEPAPVAADAGPGIAVRPAEAARRPRAGTRRGCASSTAGRSRGRGRLVADPQLDRVDAEATASSSIADSSAYIPGLSPGARIHVGAGTSSPASRWRGAQVGRPYIIRVHGGGLLGELGAVEVCSTTSWTTAVSWPSASAPSRGAGSSACDSRSARTSAGGSAPA